MKKDEAQKIGAFLGTLKNVFETMRETARMMADEDTVSYMSDHVDEAKKMIDAFIQDLIDPKVLVLADEEKEQTEKLRRLSNKEWQYLESDGEEPTPTDWKQLFKARLYLGLLRLIRERGIPLEIASIQDISTYIEAELLPKTTWSNSFYSSTYIDSGSEAIARLAHHVLNERSKHPQLKIFS